MLRQLESNGTIAGEGEIMTPCHVTTYYCLQANQPSNNNTACQYTYIANLTNYKVLQSTNCSKKQSAKTELPIRFI